MLDVLERREGKNSSRSRYTHEERSALLEKYSSDTAENSDDHEMMVMKGITLAAKECHDDALHELICANATKEDSDVYTCIGILLAIKGKYKSAVENLVKAIVIDHNNYIAYNNLGIVDLIYGHFMDAAENFRISFQANPRYVSAVINCGLAYFAAGRMKEAIENFNTAVVISTTSPANYYYRGLSYMKIDRYKEAVDNFDTVIEYDDEFKGVYLNRAKANMSYKEYKKALADFGIAMARDPQNVEIYYHKAYSYEMLGDAEKAKANYDHAAKLDSSFVAKTLCDRGKEEKELGRVDEAIAYFTKAIKVAPDYADAYLGRTILYILEGDAEKANRDFSILERINGELANMVEHVFAFEPASRQA
ncbi:tetratricopeptide repeat protein [Thermodesulfobacteriota bacterium]